MKGDPFPPALRSTWCWRGHDLGSLMAEKTLWWHIAKWARNPQAIIHCHLPFGFWRKPFTQGGVSLETPQSGTEWPQGAHWGKQVWWLSPQGCPSGLCLQWATVRNAPDSWWVSFVNHLPPCLKGEFENHRTHHVYMHFPVSWHQEGLTNPAAAQNSRGGWGLL